MQKLITVLGKIPGWGYTLGIFGLLYLSGMHTEAIGQVQRVILATGLMQPNLPETAPAQIVAETTPAAVAPAEEFLLQDLSGKTVKFSSLKNKVVFLNFWATWCPPCVAEMPGIQSLYDKLKGNKNIVFLMVSLDQNGTEKVKNFIAKKSFTMPVYLPASNIPEAFQTQSIPTTFILGKDGKIATSHKGMANYDTPEIKEFLEKLAE